MKTNPMVKSILKMGFTSSNTSKKNIMEKGFLGEVHTHNKQTRQCQSIPKNKSNSTDSVEFGSHGFIYGPK